VNSNILTEILIDQFVPVHAGKRSPTSHVYEFSFDFNVDLMRRDTNNTSIRLDYSNIKGYWDALVDSPGIQSRDLGSTLGGRFFAPTNEDWEKAYSSSSSGVNLEWNPSDAVSINEDMSAAVFWQTAEECPISSDDYGEGFGAYVTGSLDATFYYGFSILVGVHSLGSG
jgi:chitinase